MVNEELNKIYEWLNTNKLWLNADKAKYSLFDKTSKTDDLPFLLSKLLSSLIFLLLINDNEVEKVSWSLNRWRFILGKAYNIHQKQSG